MAASVLAPAADRAEDPYVIPRVATFDDDPKSRPEMPVWTSHDVAWLATLGLSIHRRETLGMDQRTMKERDLAVLLANAEPVLRAGEFGFCCFPNGVQVPFSLTPLLYFVEEEGTTLVVPLDQARRNGIACEFPARMITLNVNSALDAIGFLAVITARLAAAGISVNAVSAFHHDHIFVPANRAEDAMRLLSTLV